MSLGKYGLKAWTGTRLSRVLQGRGWPLTAYQPVSAYSQLDKSVPAAPQGLPAAAQGLPAAAQGLLAAAHRRTGVGGGGSKSRARQMRPSGPSEHHVHTQRVHHKTAIGAYGLEFWQPGSVEQFP